MLEFIRRHSSSIGVKIFLTILALTFVFCFGLPDVIRKLSGKDYLVKIGKVRISPAAFKQERAKKINMLKSSNRNIDEKSLTSGILHQIIWENIIDLASRDFGFIVSDGTMKEYIGGMHMFRDERGRFNASLLRNLLYKLQIPEQMFLELSKKEIKSALIKAALKYVAITNEIDLYTSAHLEKRKLSLVELNPASFEVKEKPSVDKLMEFYRNNSDLFMVEEFRSFQILELSELSVEKDIVLAEEDLKEAYEYAPERKERTYEEMKTELSVNLKQEKLHSRINEITRQIEDTLMAGESVENVAKKFNLRVTKVENVNGQNKNAKSQEVLKVSHKNDIISIAFSIDEGTDSSFSEGQDDKEKRIFWLVHLDSVTPKHVEEFEKVSDKALQEWIKDQQHRKALAMANDFVAKINEGGSLEKLATENGRISNTSPAFDRSGAVTDDKSKKFADIISVIYKEAFSKNKGDGSQKEINGKIVAYQIKDIISSEQNDSKDAAKYRTNLSQEMTDDLYQELVGYLSKKYEVTINYEMLKESTEGLDTSELGEIF
ncbi:MAG: SurA N-terminal domain-containing protein [Holosporaceae bacterium]|jgi:hypothetical protein|nr:SurA N-terminal domain-containing protein [Holosporaceae bacterium]